MKLGEAHWRYSLFAELDHELVQRAINLDVVKHYQPQRESSTAVDLEDSQTILRAYIDRMTSAHITHPFTDAVTMIEMMAFVIPNIIPGVEDQLIPFVKVTLDYFWLNVSGNAPSKNYKLEIEDIVGLISSIKYVLVSCILCLLNLNAS